MSHETDDKNDKLVLHPREDAAPADEAALTPADEAGTLDETEQRAGKDEQKANDSKAALALKKLVDEDDEDEPINVSLRTILGGDILGGRWFRRNFWYLVLIAALLLFYVANRYACQQEMIEGTHLRDTLQDRRYKALTLSAQLKEMTRRSEVERQLTDTTLKTPTTDIYALPVDAADTTAGTNP